MPEYLEDPSVLTKERLKNELLAHNVELPGSTATKDVYVQLYLKNLTARNTKTPGTTLDGFSSDEDLPPPVVLSRSRSSGGRKAIKKTDKVQREDLDVADLTAEGLKDELLKYGVDAGPIVASTRRVYEKKLMRLQEDGLSAAPPDLLPAQNQTLTQTQTQTQTQTNHNGHSDLDQFSDKEDEEPRGFPEPEPEVIPEPEPLPEPIPLVERLVRSRGKTPVSTRARSSQHSKVEKVVVAQTPKAEDRDVLKEVSTNDLHSPTGIIASCRKPIRGAAGRPVQPGDFWKDESLLLSPKSLSSSSTTTTSTTSTYTETRHRPPALLLSPPPPSTSSSASRLLSSAPPAAQTREARSSFSVWLKLVLLVLLAAFLFFVYQTMEADALSPFGRAETEPAAPEGTA